MDNFTQDTNELLMRYLDGEMDIAEKKAFEEQLAADKTLQEEVDRLQEAKVTVRSYGLKKEIEQVHASMMKEFKHVAPVRKMSSFQKVVRYSVAIAACAALVFISIEGYKFYKLSPNDLYTENHIAYTPDNPRGTEPKENEIETAYREKRYADVTKIVFHRSLTPRESFLRGLSYLETGDLSRAITSFQSVLSDSMKTIDVFTKDGTEYYLALAYLKNRDYDESIELMNKIHDDPRHTYNERFSSKYIRRVKMLKWR